MKRYLTSNWDNKITPFTITRETEKCYFFQHPGARKEDRRLKDHNYHLTYANARKHIIKREQTRVESAERALDNAKGKLTHALLIPEAEPGV